MRTREVCGGRKVAAGCSEGKAAVAVASPAFFSRSTPESHEKAAAAPQGSFPGAFSPPPFCGCAVSPSLNASRALPPTRLAR